MRSFLVFLLEDLASSSDETRSPGRDEADLLSVRRVAADCRRVADVLMITTTMGMLDGVHGDTSDHWPILLLGLLLVISGACLQEGLVGSSTAGADADHGSAAARNGLPGAGWESNSAFLSVFGVTNDDSRGSAGPCESAAVTFLCLTVGDDRAFGHCLHGKHVANSKGSY